MRKEAYRAMGCAALAGAVLLGLAVVVSLVSPRHGSAGRFGFALEKGQVLVLRASEPVRWVSGRAWMFANGAGVGVGPRRVVLPSRVEARLTAVTKAGRTVATLKGAYVPLGPGIVVLGAAGVWLWRRGRRPAPGHCGVCGYDLSGLKGGRCPECGEGMVLRVWRRVRGLVRGRAVPVGLLGAA